MSVKKVNINLTYKVIPVGKNVDVITRCKACGIKHKDSFIEYNKDNCRIIAELFTGVNCKTDRIFFEQVKVLTECDKSNINIGDTVFLPSTNINDIINIKFKIRYISNNGMMTIRRFFDADNDQLQSNRCSDDDDIYVSISDYNILL